MTAQTVQFFPVQDRPGYMLGSDGTTWKRIASMPSPRIPKRQIASLDTVAGRRHQIAKFLEDSTEETNIEHERAAKQQLYFAYVKWCESIGETAQTVRVFNSTVKNDFGQLDMKTDAGDIWYKIKIRVASE
jgi:hypothetical protein